MKRFLQVVALGATLTTATAGWAADVCIDAKARESLNACGGAQLKEFDVGKRGKQPQTNFHSAPPPADLKKRDQQTKPNQPSLVDAPRDERKSRLQARQRALLATEIQGLERLFETTAKNKPDRPQLARRLAEAYVELEAAAFREKTENEIKRDEAKKKDPKSAGQFQTNAQQAEDLMKKARQRAITFYRLIVTDYPNYSALDEVLYYLAYEYEQANDLQNARTVYYELIQKTPNSKYIPNAYLAFGELFFNEAQGDPSKWDLARQAYEKVLGYPVDKGNKVYGYAFYKLAYVHWNKGELEKSLNAFKKTIEFGVTHSQLPGAPKLADSARRDIIPVYALKGDPDKAYNFFHGISGDEAGKNTLTLKMMDDLGNNYLDTGHYPEAITLYRDLISRDKTRICVYQSHITEATMAMKSNNKDAIVKEIDAQVKVHDATKNGNYTAEAKKECANKTAALATETAMAWHLEAVGSGGQRGTGDLKSMQLAAYLYKKVVDTWPQTEFATFEFPRIVKEDWPNIYKIKYAMADLLYFQKDWAKCGPAFDSVVQENPQAPEAAEAAYAAVLCYQNIYEETHKGGKDRQSSGNMPGKKDEKTKKAEEAERLKPKEMTENQKGMVSAFNKYICYIKPAKNDNAGQEQLVEVKYARSRTYFEAQHWDEAAIGFKEIAMEHSDREVGIYAAQLYLESINVMGQHFSKPSCYEEMGQDVPKFLELYCQGDKAQKNADQCTTLNKIQVDILRLQAQAMIDAADKQGGKDAIERYGKGGTAYFEMFRKYCQDPVNAGQQPQAEKCDEIAYNAARAFQAARLVAKAITVRRALISFDEKTKGNSPLAKKSVYEIGGNYQAIAVYDQAAQWYEQYAKNDPKAPEADKALSDAVILRLGLGQEQEAINDAAVFQKNYGAQKPAQTASIAFAIGAHYIEKEDWEKAHNELGKSMPVIDRAAPDIQAQARAALAKAFLGKFKTGGEVNAAEEYNRVRNLWKDPTAAEAKIRAAYPNEDDAQKDRRLAKALNAVGEAYFFFAEQKRKKDVDPLKFPAYAGPGDKAAVLKHIQVKVADWYKKKKEAIEKVEPEYVKILELKPVPPPKWVIAAGSRAGLMWGDFVDDFRRAPIPEAWKKDPEIRGTYYDALDRASEPFKVGHAKPALKKCLDLSVKFQYFDEFSRACEVWLAKNYKAEYHVVDELRGAPTLSNSGLDEKAPPVLTDGTFWHPPAAAPEKKEGENGNGDDKDKATPKAGPAPKAAPAKQQARPLPGGKKK